MADGKVVDLFTKKPPSTDEETLDLDGDGLEELQRREIVYKRALALSDAGLRKAPLQEHLRLAQQMQALGLPPISDAQLADYRAATASAMPGSPTYLFINPLWEETRVSAGVREMHAHEHRALVLVLQNNYEDLVVDKVGISVHLNFGGSRPHCFVPWFAMIDVKAYAPKDEQPERRANLRAVKGEPSALRVPDEEE
jgi:hypothetical protein